MKSRGHPLTRLLPLLLLLIRDSPRLSLGIPHLTEVDPDRPVGKRVRLRAPSVFLIGRPEAAHEGIKAAPRLPQGAGAGARGFGLPEEHAPLYVNLSLPELVQVPHEFEHVAVVALGQRHRRPLVPEVLPEGVPIPPLLGLVPAELRRWVVVVVGGGGRS